MAALRDCPPKLVADAFLSQKGRPQSALCLHWVFDANASPVRQSLLRLVDFRLEALGSSNSFYSFFFFFWLRRLLSFDGDDLRLTFVVDPVRKVNGIADLQGSDECLMNEHVTFVLLEQLWACQETKPVLPLETFQSS